MKILITIITICAAAQAAVRPPTSNYELGGELVDIKDFPYQVSVRNYDIHICSGSIIDDRTILTAAHCFYSRDRKKIGVRVGDSDQSKGIYFAVTDVIVASEYNDDFNIKDMAILKLASHITFSATIQPIQLPPKGFEVPTNSIVWVSGWSRFFTNVKQDRADLLHAADVRVTSLQECSFAYGVGKINIDMLCTHNNEKYMCLGDAGGPVAFNNTLIGVVSWTYECINPQYPMVHVKVSTMHDWIVEHSD